MGNVFQHPEKLFGRARGIASMFCQAEMKPKLSMVSFYAFLILLISGAVFSCSDEKADSGYLSGKFRLDFATVRLENTIPVLALDSKDTLRATAISTFGFTKKDGQRVLVNHSPDEGSGIVLNSVSDILTSRIFTAKLDTLPSDPVKIQSVWTGGGHLNVILYMNYYSRKHRFGLYRSAESPNALYLSHDKQGDSEGYPIRIYMSFYLNGLQKSANDSTSFSVSIPTSSGDENYNFVFL
jgi:NigD-like C-terminal beta sandwich domain/NigD-like N-terminal OB domain